MTPELFLRAKAIFLEACDLPREERPSFLDSACGETPDLRATVEKLLESDDDPIALNTGAIDKAGIDDLIHDEIDGNDAVPSSIGDFRIIRKIGEGGMGAVYEAEQSHPRRVVALKMMRPSYGGSEMLKRFRREIDLLGQLDHTGIARIFQAGTMTTPSGEQPYFAMELIRGELLTGYVKSHNLGIRSRVEIIAAVCDAVHFAHLRGVVHRDIKPGNIMVTEGDRPVILDFGVARATNSDIQATTVTINPGQIIGTLAYMSPEQASGASGAIDAKTDIYALGVVLYELLAGVLPHDLEGKTLADAALTIRDEEPTRLSYLDRQLKGDLETIVLKAMEKDSERRYESAAALSLDLRRFLADKPIVARPPSTVYELRKFAKRNKALVTTITLASIALLVIAVFATFKAIAATEARELAEQEADRSKTVVSFLSDVLSSANPDRSLGKETTVRMVLDEAAERIRRDDLANHPATRAQLHMTIGRSYLALGNYAESKAHLESALDLNRQHYGDSHLAVADSLDHLANTLLLINDYSKSEEYFREAFKIREEILGSDMAIGASSPHSLASVFYYKGRYEEAEELYRQLVEYWRKQEKSESLSLALSGLGATLEARAQYDAAISSHREAAVIYEELYGEINTHHANTLNNLANAMQAAGRSQEAEEVHRRALKIRLQILSPDHPDLAMSYANLGLVLLDLNKPQESEALSRKAMEIRDKCLPKVHHTRAASLNNLAKAILAQGRIQEACDYYEQAVKQVERVLPEGHLMVLALRANRANCRAKMGKTEIAETELRECYKQMAAGVGPDHRRTKVVAEFLINLFEATGRSGEADAWRDELASRR
ncbi:MAG: serine/threonine-protein kinase [Phycisphaerales bacterium]|nr:serine/threonine-protein kinase [Phycisphaerales bacterium]